MIQLVRKYYKAQDLLPLLEIAINEAKDMRNTARENKDNDEAEYQNGRIAAFRLVMTAIEETEDMSK